MKQMRSFAQYACITAATVAMVNAPAAQQPSISDKSIHDSMSGIFSCTVEHMAGIQYKNDKTPPLVGSITPAADKFVLSITRYTPPEWCTAKESKEAFPEICMGKFAAKMTPRLTNEETMYGTSGDIFFSQSPVAYLWMTKEMGITIAVSAFNSTYAIRGRCVRFESASPTR
jgi:hypothetical protein